MNFIQKTEVVKIGLWILIFSTFGFVKVSSQTKESNQDQHRQILGSSARVLTLPAAPEATEECSPDECEWYDRLRNSVLALRHGIQERSPKKRDQDMRKAMEAYFLLLQEGHDRDFRVPLSDRAPQMLFASPPQRSLISRKQNVKGEIKIAISVSEFGLVTDVELQNRLGWGLDEQALASARQGFFFPAVKDGQFVPYSTEVTIKFH